MKTRVTAYITEHNGSLVLRSSYDPALVAALKSQIPTSGRRFDPVSKAWIIAPQYGRDVVRVVSQTLGITIEAPTPSAAAVTTSRLIQLDYLGQAKDRGDGQLSAYGYSGGDWRLVFPLGVLKTWFCESSKPDESPTLYSVLGVTNNAQPAEIIKAYRRAARTWHPDVCHEPDASEQFKRIQSAYEILQDGNTRARYDAGLQLAATATREPSMNTGPTWRPPLRCGYLLVECTEQVGRLVVSRILQWQDVVNAQGQTMVTSWRAGDDKPTVRYV